MPTDRALILAWLRYLERTASSPESKGCYGFAADGVERGDYLMEGVRNER
jgi:hypothetical protein